MIKTWASIRSVGAVFALGFMIAGAVHADERVLPGAVLESMGFVPVARREVATPAFSTLDESILPAGLAWPVTFASASQSIAQNYVNFQDYGGGAYFHGGCDLRAEASSWMITPVEGILEGGYYGYDTNEDGSNTKYWKPWNGTAHEDPYFELAIVTDSGHRYEFHHVDSMDLPEETIAALDRGGVRIKAGTRLGRVLNWGFSGYHHIHYNIYDPRGVALNPEALSVQVRDTVAPRIQGVYALDSQGRVSDVREGSELDAGMREIVVATTESRDQDAFVQTPPFVALEFASGQSSSWDFRQKLRDANGGFPDIRKVFMPKLRTPSGQTLKTSGQYGKGLFLMRLPVPAGASGAFTVRVGDTAGNESRVSARLR